jgi:acetoacetyl-CoA synthetase
MMDAKWFTGAQTNYVHQVFRHVDAAHAAALPAIISHNEKSLGAGWGDTDPVQINWPLLRQKVAALALHLRAQGVQPGDRVAGYLPNIPEAAIAFLATASIGAVWSICAPDMGVAAVLDRFKQIEPVVLIAVDGVTYAGRDLDRRAVVAQLCAGLPSVRHLIVHGNLGLDLKAINTIANYSTFTGAIAQNDSEVAAFIPLWLAFDHPLWIVYSSGTTGLPKPIVHGHGGTVMVALAGQGLHYDIACSYAANSLGERFHWYSSTGWVMWNAQVNGLLFGATCCIFDGSPSGPAVNAAGEKQAPDWTTLWRFAAALGVTYFGAGAAFYGNCMKAGVDLSRCGPLTQVRTLGTTGSPLSEDVQNWGNAQFASLGTPHMWWSNVSGGTDFAGAFVGGNRELPQVPGEMQCRMLGCAVEAWNDDGLPVVDEVGELVCTRPLPSMPLYFWDDTNNVRYFSSYFDTFPAKNGQSAPWRHGDWIKIGRNGGCIIYGRSDATINRHGLRMGTSELYSAIEALPEVMDSLVVDLEYLGRASYMPLFVVLREGVVLDDALRTRLNNAIKTALSPRFVPDEIFQVAEVPRTLSGKKQELPVKKLLLGQRVEAVINKEAMANPACLDWYVGLAGRLKSLRG